MDDLGYSLESFVEKVELPHRAKITEGYYEPGDEEGDREFSNGEILEIRRLICPFVDLTFKHPATSDQESRITISTRSQDLRFRVITEKEALGLAQPRVFRDVREVIDRWPNAIKSLSDHFVEIPGTDPVAIARGERLRPIRVIVKAEDTTDVRLELKASSTRRLVQLPVGFEGIFTELDDPRFYTLQEIVDVARVERYLRLHALLELGETRVRGLPKDFEGVLRMEKPQAFVEIARVLVNETSNEEYTGQPILCPINCDIRLTPRDVLYMPLPVESVHLASLGEDYSRRLPFIARIVSWTDETSILQNQVTKPGDHLVVYSRTTVDKILAHCGKNYFLIPVDHKGSFRLAIKSSKELKEVKLGSLETRTFPIKVHYVNTSEYRNTADERLPSTEELVFDKFVKAEPCVVVSKLFGDAIGSGFRLPLRTKITIRMERRWKKSMTAPQHKSHLDSCSEEISEELHHEIMRSSEGAQVPEAYGIPRKDLPPAVPLRLGRPDVALANRPQPPLPTTAQVSKGGNSDEDDDSENDYSYIDVRCMNPLRRESTLEREIDKGIIEIPVNGNISQFSVYQMVFFLRENNASYQTLSTWKRKGLDGMAFARMTDDDLKTHGIANPVIQFFRDRSKMQLVLTHL